MFKVGLLNASFIFIFYIMLPSLFVWNCQGCAFPKLVRMVKRLLCYFEVDVAAFLETRVSGLKANRIIARIVLDCSHRIKARGFARSLWVCWKNNVQVQILLNDPQFIHCHLGKKLGSINFLVTFVYGYLDKQKRKALWDFLDQVTHFINEP
ncbi:hypothetical protein ES332_D10G133200v1 [Gossypium tomentosum]|uniref:Uncharacterized protein n=1 Tax=Gossypium tomentosum TaxID=34277 RepID=A0A5D2J3T5_GOSTO|nr:hypothetical protein ES332_D10G133200v1 [Gossypium tomentosum]